MQDDQQDNKLGPWLADMLAGRRMSQAELARRAGVDPSVVSKWVRGVQRPDSTSSALIAEALAVDAGEVLAVAGHMRRIGRATGDSSRDHIHDLVDLLPAEALAALRPLLEYLAPGHDAGPGPSLDPGATS